MILSNICENEFRGKTKDTDEWVYGYLAAFDLICPSYPEDTTNATGEYYGQTPYVGFIEVKSETVGQYIGGRDKNQNPIFVGDVVQFANSDGLIWRAIVVRNSGGFGFEKGFDRYDLDLDRVNVVGNIHDSPNILYC